MSEKNDDILINFYLGIFSALYYSQKYLQEIIEQVDKIPCYFNEYPMSNNSENLNDLNNSDKTDTLDKINDPEYHYYDKSEFDIMLKKYILINKNYYNIPTYNDCELMIELDIIDEQNDWGLFIKIDEQNNWGWFIDPDNFYTF